MTSLSELRAQQQLRQQSRRPPLASAVGCPSRSLTSIIVYEKSKDACSSKSVAQQANAPSLTYPQVSRLRVTNPDVEESEEGNTSNTGSLLNLDIVRAI